MLDQGFCRYRAVAAMVVCFGVLEEDVSRYRPQHLDLPPRYGAFERKLVIHFPLKTRRSSSSEPQRKDGQGRHKSSPYHGQSEGFCIIGGIYFLGRIGISLMMLTGPKIGSGA